jgi:hypothetical protein
MTGEQLIIEVEKITQANLDFVERKLKYFSSEQIQWKSNEKTWSIEEVLAHMNSFAAFYHPVFEDKIETTRYDTPTVNFLSSPLGRASWRSMKLGNARNVKRAFKSTFDYNPSLNKKLITKLDREIFIKEQFRLLDIFESSKAINIRKVKVPVSISKIIKFRMGDAFLFLTYHNERHIEQIKKITLDKNFPKK